MSFLDPATNLHQVMIQGGSIELPFRMDAGADPNEFAAMLADLIGETGPPQRQASEGHSHDVGGSNSGGSGQGMSATEKRAQTQKRYR